MTSVSPAVPGHLEHSVSEALQTKLAKQILDASLEFRYVALYLDEHLETISKSGTAGSSAAESDKYEELLVNPAILKLVTQRGNIDCGGARYVLIRYGNFYQWVQPVRGGHVSVCIEPSADPLQLESVLDAVLRRNDLL
jgi:hypothetical protein